MWEGREGGWLKYFLSESVTFTEHWWWVLESLYAVLTKYSTMNVQSNFTASFLSVCYYYEAQIKTVQMCSNFQSYILNKICIEIISWTFVKKNVTHQVRTVETIQFILKNQLIIEQSLIIKYFYIWEHIELWLCWAF